MPRTVEVTLEKNTIEAESSNLLKGAKTEKLMEVSPYQIRTTIDLSTSTATEVKKKAAIFEVQRVADSFTTERFKEIDKLVADVKALLKKDQEGDGSAGGKARDLVKQVADEIEDTLPEFGKIVRKAVEKQVGKLSAAAKSSSTGVFRGIKLTAKFENSGASGLKVEVKESAKKWLAEKESILLKNITAEIEKTGVDTDGVKKVNNFYEIVCEKNPKFRIISQVKGNKFEMLAIYMFSSSGAKTYVAGENIPNFA